MTIATEIDVPRLDRARIRRLRASAGMSLEQCVQYSRLQDDWRLIECCPNVVVNSKPELVTTKRADLIEILDERIAYYENLDIDVRIAEAKIELRFIDGRRTRSVTIKPPNIAVYTRDGDADVIELFLNDRGFTNGKIIAPFSLGRTSVARSGLGVWSHWPLRIKKYESLIAPSTLANRPRKDSTKISTHSMPSVNRPSHTSRVKKPRVGSAFPIIMMMVALLAAIWIAPH
jgi:hypothetical protein